MRNFFSSLVIGIIIFPMVVFGKEVNLVQSAKPVIRQANTFESKNRNAKSSIPAQINYQGWLGTDTDTLGVNGKVNMTFKIYDTVTGGVPLWTENQDSVQVSKGIFNVLLGSITPLSESLFINNTDLYLETEVNTEVLVPRKKIVSVAYAFKSQNSDNSTNAIYADTANIATTTLSLQGNDTTAFNNKYVKKTGENMTGPLSVSANSASDLISSNQSGTGAAAYFQITNASNSNPVLYGYTTGTGSAGYFQVANASSPNYGVYANTNGTGDAVYAYTNGTGRAGYFQIANASNIFPAVYGSTNGTGSALYGYATGNGNGVYGYASGGGTGVVGYTSGNADAGFFQVNNASNPNTALHGITNGTGRAGYFQISNASNTTNALEGNTNGTGNGILGSTSGSGTGVCGTANGSGNAISGATTGTGMAGFFQIYNALNANNAIEATTNGSGPAVYAYNTGTGIAGQMQINNASSSSTAMQASTNGSGIAAYGYTNGTGSAGYFQIQNASNFNPALEANTNGSGNAIYSHTTGTGKAGYFRIDNASSVEDVIYIQSNGNGNFITASNGAILTKGGLWTDGCSREYKENIEELDAGEALSAVEKLTPVKYNYKTEKDENCVGFIAEDVPELVAMKDRKSLSPMDIVAVLTKVVQEQQKSIQEQQKEIESLKDKVNQLTK